MAIRSKQLPPGQKFDCAGATLTVGPDGIVLDTTPEQEARLAGIPGFVRERDEKPAEKPQEGAGEPVDDPVAEALLEAGEDVPLDAAPEPAPEASVAPEPAPAAKGGKGRKRG